MEIIKLTDEQIRCIETAFEREKDANIAFQAAVCLLRNSNERLWSIIHKLFPDRDAEKGELRWDTKEIIFK